MTMKRIGLMTGLFWIGAFVPAAVGVWRDIYWLGHGTAHSTAVFLTLQMVAALVVAVAGALCYGAGLSLQRAARVVVLGMWPAIIALVWGLVFLALELRFGMGVPRTTPENAGIGWTLVVVVPIAASRLTTWVLSRGRGNERIPR